MLSGAAITSHSPFPSPLLMQHNGVSKHWICCTFVLNEIHCVYIESTYRSECERNNQYFKNHFLYIFHPRAPMFLFPTDANAFSAFNKYRLKQIRQHLLYFLSQAFNFGFNRKMIVIRTRSDEKWREETTTFISAKQNKRTGQKKLIISLRSIKVMLQSILTLVLLLLQLIWASEEMRQRLRKRRHVFLWEEKSSTSHNLFQREFIQCSYQFIHNLPHYYLLFPASSIAKRYLVQSLEE